MAPPLIFTFLISRQFVHIKKGYYIEKKLEERTHDDRAGFYGLSDQIKCRLGRQPNQPHMYLLITAEIPERLRR